MFTHCHKMFVTTNYGFINSDTFGQPYTMLALYGKSISTERIPHMQELLSYLKQKQLSFAIEKNFMQLLRDTLGIITDAPVFSNFAEVRHQTEVVLSIGGDGTILESVVMVGSSEIPVLGINFGRLGFLASLGKDQVHDAIDAVASGSYMVDKRTLIELQTNKPLFDNAYALNDMTIQRRDQSSMITVNAYLNGELLNTYWADGLIISTPTGSTGYSLSCGGPIIHPTSGNFVITPVAPHNLNVRPMVVNDDVVLSFEVTGRGDSFLCTLDARSAAIDSTFQLAVKKAGFHAHIVRLSDQTFLTALKTKLNWGSDQRN